MLEKITKKVISIVNKLDRFGPTRKRLVGIVLIVLSFAFYAGIALVAMAPMPLDSKGLLSGSCWVCREITFWLGAIILGREFIVKYKKSFNPLYWYHSKKNKPYR